MAKQGFTLGLTPGFKENLCFRGFLWLETQDESAMKCGFKEPKGPQVVRLEIQGKEHSGGDCSPVCWSSPTWKTAQFWAPYMKTWIPKIAARSTAGVCPRWRAQGGAAFGSSDPFHHLGTLESKAKHNVWGTVCGTVKIVRDSRQTRMILTLFNPSQLGDLGYIS